MSQNVEKENYLFEYSIKALNDLVEIENETLSNLSSLNEVKYHSYHLYKPWNGFFEHLYRFLKQFETTEDKKTALEIVKQIIFISQDELYKIIQIIYPEKIIPYLLDQIIIENNFDDFDYSLAYDLKFTNYLLNSFFIALSDGAFIDYFRRVNNISNDNVIPYYKLHPKAQLETLSKIEKKLKKIEEKTTENTLNIFLIEDFIGTGKTFLREELNDKKEIIKNGQLVRFLEYWDEFLKKFAKKHIILVSYIITELAVNNIYDLQKKYYNDLDFHILEGIRIPEKMNLPSHDSKIKQLCEYYYNKDIETEHTLIGGSVKFGFGNAGLPLVRFNNTPNNSLYLIWNTKNWNPLFPRKSRHGD